MAFIRKRPGSIHRLYGGRYSHQLMDTYRQDGKVRQRVICNPGRSETVGRALEIARNLLEDCRKIHSSRREYGWPIDPLGILRIGKFHAAKNFLIEKILCGPQVSARAAPFTPRTTRAHCGTALARVLQPELDQAAGEKLLVSIENEHHDGCWLYRTREGSVAFTMDRDHIGASGSPAVLLPSLKSSFARLRALVELALETHFHRN